MRTVHCDQYTEAREANLSGERRHVPLLDEYAEGEQELRHSKQWQRVNNGLDTHIRYCSLLVLFAERGLLLWTPQ